MSTTASATTLTSYLIGLPTRVPYTAAVSHKFLQDAANLSLPHDRLALWLAQDRIYAAQAYPRFIALLITKIQLDAVDDCIRDRSRRTLQVLVGCLDNIVREVNFFEHTARKYDLDIGSVGQGQGPIWLERKATRDYTAEMARIASLGTLEDGLVFLWAMEKVNDHPSSSTSPYPLLDRCTWTLGPEFSRLSHNRAWTRRGEPFMICQTAGLIRALILSNS